MTGTLITSLVFSLSTPVAEPRALTLGELMTSVIDHTNKERSRVGVPRLVENDRLVMIAQEMAQDLAKTGRLSHTDSKGRGLSVRVDAGGYHWSTIGENVAYGYPSPQEVVQGWIKSPGHYQNLVSNQFTEIGIGVAADAKGRIFWAQVFGKPLR
jgi:uncharacterized protein YkwD